MNAPEPILGYLEQRMPGYPFDPNLDHDFVCELMDDFGDVDILEQAKAFRWYHDNKPAEKNKNLRTALRRWLANAWKQQPSNTTH